MKNVVMEEKMSLEKEHPLISVIVPVYNVEQYLDRCVNCILKQTFTNFELILVDDGSTDRCPQMCDEWKKKDERIVVIHKENGGAGSARNAGLKRAVGKYVCFVDSDDYLSFQMFEKLYNMLQKYQDAQIAMCNNSVSKKFDLQKLKTNSIYRECVMERSEQLSYFFGVDRGRCRCNVWGKLIDKALLSDFAFIEGTISEDVMACWFFYTNAGKIIRTEEVLYYYFKNQSGVTKSKVTEKDFEYIHAFERIAQDVEKRFPEYLEVAKMNQIRSYFTILSKMKLYGYDRKDKKMRSAYHSLKTLVRKNFKNLIGWKMSVSRKMLLFYVCI